MAGISPHLRLEVATYGWSDSARSDVARWFESAAIELLPLMSRIESGSVSSHPQMIELVKWRERSEVFEFSREALTVEAGRFGAGLWDSISTYALRGSQGGVLASIDRAFPLPQEVGQTPDVLQVSIVTKILSSAEVDEWADKLVDWLGRLVTGLDESASGFVTIDRKHMHSHYRDPERGLLDLDRYLPAVHWAMALNAHQSAAVGGKKLAATQVPGDVVELPDRHERTRLLIRTAPSIQSLTQDQLAEMQQHLQPIIRNQT